MAFKELDNKLNELQLEVNKVKAATEHIEEAKRAAEHAANAAQILSKEYGKHMSGIVEEVDQILKPHKQLIEASKNLVDAISEVDFSIRLVKIEKKLSLLLFLIIAIGGLSLIGIIINMIILFVK